jgi:hypothetical protein
MSWIISLFFDEDVVIFAPACLAGGKPSLWFRPSRPFFVVPIRHLFTIYMPPLKTGQMALHSARTTSPFCFNVCFNV